MPATSHLLPHLLNTVKLQTAQGATELPAGTAILPFLSFPECNNLCPLNSHVRFWRIRRAGHTRLSAFSDERRRSSRRLFLINVVHFPLHVRVQDLYHFPELFFKILVTFVIVCIKLLGSISHLYLYSFLKY